MKLDLGCGYRKSEDFIGVDISRFSKADVICSLEYGLPFKDQVFEEVWANQTIEHIRNLIQLMNEISRVTKIGAKIDIRVPYYRSEDAFRDPTHVRFFTPLTFGYFDCLTTWYQGYAKLYGIESRFKTVQTEHDARVIRVVYERV